MLFIWQVNYIVPKKHYAAEVRKTVCNVTAWTIYFVGDYDENVHTRLYYDYCWIVENSRYCADQLVGQLDGVWVNKSFVGLRLNAPAEGSEFPCYYQADDPGFIEFSPDVGTVAPTNTGGLARAIIFSIVLAIITLCTCGILGGFRRQYRGLWMWSPIPRWHEHKDVKQNIAEARYELIRFTETRMSMWTFLHGSHVHLGANSSIRMFVTNPMYDRNPRILLYQFLDVADDLPVLVSRFRESRGRILPSSMGSDDGIILDIIEGSPVERVAEVPLDE